MGVVWVWGEVDGGAAAFRLATWEGEWVAGEKAYGDGAGEVKVEGCGLIESRGKTTPKFRSEVPALFGLAANGAAPFGVSLNEVREGACLLVVASVCVAVWNTD